MRSFNLLGMVLTLGLYATTLAANPSDLAKTGPFAVGFTSFLLTDSTRAGDGDIYTYRPIPVFVWYPVDPRTINRSTSEGSYPLDPLYHVVGSAASSHFEAYGLDRSYQEPRPSQRGPFPLVMFSPGWGSPPFAYTSLGTRLASHGFVVAVLYHCGDQWWPWEPLADHIAVACWNRPRDVSFALTDLLVRNSTAGDLLHGLIRPDQVAAAGWSLGGYASMVLAGGDDSVGDTFLRNENLQWYGPPPPETCGPTLPDPRVKAIVPLDGANQFLKFRELARVSVPSMGIGEEWTGLALDPSRASWQARQHAAFSGRPAYRVDVLNSHHHSYCDYCEAMPVLGDLGIFTAEDVSQLLNTVCANKAPSAEVHRLVSEYMIAFLKTNLSGDDSYRQMLTPGHASTHEPLIELFVTEKSSELEMRRAEMWRGSRRACGLQSIQEEWPNNFIYLKHQPGHDRARAAKNPHAGFPLYRLAVAGGRLQAFGPPEVGDLADAPTRSRPGWTLPETVSVSTCRSPAGELLEVRHLADGE